MRGYSNRLGMIRLLDVTTSVLTTLGRLGSGASVGTLGPAARAPLELYEFEACPFCRKVREALSILDLEAIVLCRARRAGRPSAARARAGRARAVPVSRRSEHRRGDVRVERHRRVSVRRVRRRPRARARSRWARDGRSSMLAGLARLGARQPLPARARARPAAGALLVRGVAVLPDRARGAVEPRARLSAAQRGAGQPAPRGVRASVPGG